LFEFFHQLNDALGFVERDYALRTGVELIHALLAGEWRADPTRQLSRNNPPDSATAASPPAALLGG
jgi:hypothetical protein